MDLFVETKEIIWSSVTLSSRLTIHQRLKRIALVAVIAATHHLLPRSPEAKFAQFRLCYNEK